MARPARGQDTSRVSVPCAGQRIDSISVYSAAPSVSGVRRVPVLGDIARASHVTTRASVIRRYLLLEVGDPCNELRRAESERILRAEPFIADATIVALPDSSGGVELEVRTSDETSLIVGGTVSAAAPVVRAFRLGSANFNGSALAIVGDWRDGRAYRDEFGLRVIDRQFAGNSWVLDGEARQRSLGRAVSLEASRPFYTDLQHTAWRGGGGVDDDYVDFVSGGVRHALRLDRTFMDLGGLARIGHPGELALLGTSLTVERDDPGAIPVLITTTGLQPDTASELTNRYQSHRVARLNALLGARDIRYVPVRGVDALRGTQDFPVGVQVGTELGHSVSLFGEGDDDVFASTDFYFGAGGPTNGMRMQLSAEGRRAGGAANWDGILTTGRAEQFRKLDDDDVLLLTGEWSGGWRQRVPFRLTLSDPTGGLRGFRTDDAPAGRRAVVRIEERSYRGTMSGLADVGFAAFADAGRTWAGDVPFGVDQKLRASVGVSLLASAPPGSARLWRVDLAVPVTRGAKGLEIRFSSADWTTFFWPEPRDVERTRDRTVPRSVFAWP